MVMEWTANEDGIMKMLYPVAKHADILKALPERTWPAIVQRARALRIRRKAITDLHAKEVFEYVVQYKRRFDGNSPSLREIVASTPVSSTSMAKRILGNLEGQGLLTTVPGNKRSIMIRGGKWTTT